jgi:hypothetical protein
MPSVEPISQRLGWQIPVKGFLKSGKKCKMYLGEGVPCYRLYLASVLGSISGLDPDSIGFLDIKKMLRNFMF